MSIIYLDLVYPDVIKYQSVVKKSKKFFERPEFHYRNGVFTHSKLDFSLLVKKNRIHITMPNDNGIQERVNEYLKSVFGDTFVGVDMPKNSPDLVLKSLNYTLM